ncbi:MAG TPA: molybdopterin-dependent oxidoreductase [Herpetosiphonaceae bacterium]|jgi:DMSO/TMAO reductase YedYZ molybdopterin-dependent catalytic subunit|nr:molybdopterin-dependent oxidoreductase [Herpetosiphonaceae bacterium]
MTPRGTDWTLAFLVALLFTTGILSLVSGEPGDAWVFVLHGIGGATLGFVVGWKLRRVWRRVLEPRRWERRTLAGALAAGVVAVTLLSGWVWSSGGDLYVAGFNLLNWHIALGVLLTLAVAMHGRLRAKPLRRQDALSRRQALHMAGITTAAAVLWWLQRPASAYAGWRGAKRRWTGSYEQGSFSGNSFPATSWVADQPRRLSPEDYRLVVTGLVRQPLDLPLRDLQAQDTLRATLDCTGGFFSTQEWGGVRVGRLLEAADPLATATHVRVVSYTGYRWSFPIEEARHFLLATTVGTEALSHAHGAPMRLAAPGRRGFQWIKWVVRLEVRDGPDPGAAASTLWSSWTPEGRGEV